MARAEGDVVITVGGNVSPLTEAVTKAERTLGRLNGATQKADKAFRAMVGTSTALQAQLDAVTGITERTGKSAEKAAQAFEGFDKSRQAVDRLRASYDPLFAASKRYEVALEELDSALSLGVITQSQYAQMTQKLATSMMTLEGQQRSAGRGSNILTMQVQNASYQVGDFFVQIASGTGAMRAMAQQLPQLLGGFGMWGAVAGAAAAIGGALIPVLFGAEEKANTLDERMQDLSSTVGGYSSAVKAARAATGELIENYGLAAFAARDFLTAIAEGEKFKALAAARAEIKALYDETLVLRDVMVGAFSDMPEQILTFKEAIWGAGEGAAKVAKAMQDLAGARTIRDQVAAARTLLGAMDDVRASTGQWTAQQQEAYDRVAEIGRILAEISGITDEATGATNSWASAMAGVKSEIYGIAAAIASIGGGMIDNAAKFVELNARKAGKSKAEAARARKLYEIEADYQDALSKGETWGEKFAAGANKALAEAGLRADEELAALDAAEREAGKKGGGGKGDREGERRERNLERLQQDFMSEQELLAVQYEERLIGLQEARANELLTEEQYNALKLQAQADFNDKMRGLDRAALQEKLSAWSGAFGDMAGLMNTGNKKLFKIGKMAAIAQAVVDGWSAATSAWDKGMKVGGPPTAAAFTAMSIARTGAMLASIKSTQFDGGGQGGGAGGGAVAAAAPMPIQRIDVAWNGPSESRGGIQELLDSLSDAAARGLRVDARLVGP